MYFSLKRPLPKYGRLYVDKYGNVWQHGRPLMSRTERDKLIRYAKKKAGSQK